VFGLGPATRIYLAAGVTDMRKGFEGLYGLVRDRLSCEPLSGHLFLFCNGQRNRLDYFSAILPGLADLPIRRLPDLTPAAWAAQRSYQTTGCWSECEVMSTIGHESHVSELNVT